MTRDPPPEAQKEREPHIGLVPSRGSRCRAEFERMPKEIALTFGEFGRSEISSLSDTGGRPPHAPALAQLTAPRGLGPAPRDRPVAN
jgi:hypothetical protein